MNYKSKNKPFIIAHRGYSEVSPENTKKAFDDAYIKKFIGLEIDVHQTKDNELVVIHDETVDRTSDGTGKVINLTLKELKKLNFAYKFDKNLKKQIILTYEEFLKEYGFKFKIINIEIKTDILHYDKIEEKILKITKKIKPTAKIIYSSFNFETIRILRKLDKDVILGFLFVGIEDIEDIFKELKEICQYIHPWFKTLLDEKSLEVYKKTGLKINSWTFDKRETLDEWTKDSNKYYEKISKIKEVYSLISNSFF